MTTEAITRVFGAIKQRADIETVLEELRAGFPACGSGLCTGHDGRRKRVIQARKRTIRARTGEERDGRGNERYEEASAFIYTSSVVSHDRRGLEMDAETIAELEATALFYFTQGSFFTSAIGQLTLQGIVALLQSLGSGSDHSDPDTCY